MLSLASYLDRALTWGLESVERNEILHEREADRFEHVADPEASMASIVARSVWSSVADVWYRFVGAETSALPLAIMSAVVGVGAIVDAFTLGITPTLAGLNVVAGIGYVAMAAAGMRQPRKLQRTWLLPGLVLASFGTIAGAIMLPATAEAGLYGWVAKIALAGVGTGLSCRRRRDAHSAALQSGLDHPGWWDHLGLGSDHGRGGARLDDCRRTHLFDSLVESDGCIRVCRRSGRHRPTSQHRRGLTRPRGTKDYCVMARGGGRS